VTRPLAFLLSTVFACAASAATPSPTRAVIPLHFEANRGQTDPRAQFIARAGEHVVYLGRGEAFIALEEGSNATRTVRLSFPGANPAAAGTGVEKFAGRVNYLMGNDPAGWHTGIPAYGRVEYPQVYPGVDLVFHGRQQHLEYDFIVAPGADAGVITIQFEGADRIQLDAQGDLLIHAGAQQFRQHAPKAFQKTRGFPVAVPVRYAFKDARTVTFTLGAYDHARELIIDPMISYSTYIGGRGRDRAWTVAVDGSGSAYVAGDTRSIFRELPLSGTQTNRGSANGDGFVAKLNAGGSGFDYLTYIGGKDIDGIVAIALDGGNNAYLAGYTTSPNFPITPGAFQRKIRSSDSGGFTVYRADAFVSKLNEAGDSLLYSTFYGGKKTESALGVAVDADGNALICGFTDSKDLPTNNAAQPKLKGGKDAFVAKFSPDGTALLYGTYLGGVSGESANGIAVDAQGNAAVVGFTQTPSFPAKNAFPTTNAFQPLFGGGGRDAFLTKYSPAGSVIFSTCFGGAGFDQGYSVHYDSAGDLYLSGSKASKDFPTSAGINQGGVFTSTDGGSNWTLRSTGLAQNRVQAIAALDAQPLQAFAGTLRGLFATVDGGVTWVSRNSDLESQDVTAIALDPTDANVIYLGTASTVQKSTNGGLNWTTNDAGLTAGNIRALALQPGLSSTLYAGSRGGGVYVSSNSAASWTRISSGLGSLSVNALAVDPATPSILYAATDGGVYKSTNSGTKWFSRNNGLAPSKRAQALLLDAAAPSTLYAGTVKGLFKSIDGADTWSLIGAGVIASNITALALDSSTSNLYIGTTNGVFLSADAGSTFTTNGAGLNTPAVASLAAPAGLVYAGLRGTNAFGGTNDAFLTKFSADGSNILYSVVLGGSKGDEGFSAAVAADGSVVLAGATASKNFPVIDPPSAGQSTNAGRSDAWVAKIDPTGSALEFSFYLGGKQNDFGEAVAVDADGGVYLAGFTSSSDFPALGAIQGSRAGGADAFITKLEGVPQITVETSSTQWTLRWPAPAVEYQLEALDASGGTWQRVRALPEFRGGWNTVVLPAATTSRFFRLTRP
jgi:photosystem II stability/assembly factor-like uncharacterized protein